MWSDGLSDLPVPALRMGMHKVKNFTGFMTLPAFRELCTVTPADFGMTDPHSAYIEACNKLGAENAHWTHPAVYHAAVETGWFNLRTSTEKEVYPLFRRNYETMCSRVIAGESLDMPVQRALPSSATPVFLTPEQNKRRCASLKELLA